MRKNAKKKKRKKKSCYLPYKESRNLLCTLERSWKVFDFILAFMKPCLNLFSGAYTTEALSYWNRETACLTADTVSQRVKDFNAGFECSSLYVVHMSEYISAWGMNRFQQGLVTAVRIQYRDYVWGYNFGSFFKYLIKCASIPVICSLPISGLLLWFIKHWPHLQGFFSFKDF